MSISLRTSCTAPFVGPVSRSVRRDAIGEVTGKEVRTLVLGCTYTGGADATWNPSANGDVRAVALDSTGAVWRSFGTAPGSSG